MTAPQGRDWTDILRRARELASANGALSLRDLHAALVAEGVLTATRSDYVLLSRFTANERRAGRFPALVHATSVRVLER